MQTLILLAAAPGTSTSPSWMIPVFGFIGVIIGGLITIAGQAAGRRAERRNEIEKLAADLAGSTYMMESGLRGLIEYLGLPPEKQTYELGMKHADVITKEVAQTSSLGNQLSIRAMPPLRDAAIELINTCVLAQNYLHPEFGTGRDEGFKDTEARLTEISNKREAMINVARDIHPLTFTERVSAIGLHLRKKPTSD